MKMIVKLFDTVKKYSLVREYGRNGFPVDKIIAHNNFDKMSPNDIYRIIRTKADKIHTVINAGEEAVELTDNNTSQIDKYLENQISVCLFLGICIMNIFLA